MASETNREHVHITLLQSTQVEQPSPGMHSRLFMKAKPLIANIRFHWHRSPKSLKRLEWGTLQSTQSGGRLGSDEPHPCDQNEICYVFPVVPTCQVRVVRFYVSASATSPPWLQVVRAVIPSAFSQVTRKPCFEYDSVLLFENSSIDRVVPLVSSFHRLYRHGAGE